MGVNSLPKTVTRQHRGCDLKTHPTVPKSSTLTTRLPSHPYLSCHVTPSHLLRRITHTSPPQPPPLSQFHQLFFSWIPLSVSFLYLLQNRTFAVLPGTVSSKTLWDWQWQFIFKQASKAYFKFILFQLKWNELICQPNQFSNSQFWKRSELTLQLHSTM